MQLHERMSNIMTKLKPTLLQSKLKLLSLEWPFAEVYRTFPKRYMTCTGRDFLM